MQASWAVGVGKAESDLLAGLFIHGQPLGLRWDRCFEGFPDGVTAVSAGGPSDGWNLGIPGSHPVATRAAGRLAQGRCLAFIPPRIAFFISVA